MTPEETVAWMKKNHVLAFKNTDGLEIHLDPDAFQPDRVDVKPDAVDGPPMNVVGSTGMTRQEQIDLFGTTFEADFKPVKAKK